MKLGPLFGWGIVIYAVTSLVWSGLVMYGINGGFTARAIEFVVLLVVCVIAGRALKFKTWKDILPYSIFWTIVAGVLDVIFAVPVSGWGVYSQWSVWAGYALVVLLPLLAPLTRITKEPHGIWES